MKPKVPPRIWLPLLIISEEQPFVGKTRLQKLAFLVQFEARLDLYDFKKHHYGPYSYELDLDVSTYPELIYVQTRQSLYSFPEERNYYVFFLTPEGGRIKDELESSLPSDKVSLARQSLRKFIKVSLDELFDHVYRNFIREESIERRYEELRINLSQLERFTSSIFKRYGNRQALFVLVLVDYLKQVLMKTEEVNDQVRRGVIINLIGELCETLTQVVNDIAPPVDTRSLRVKFTDIAETWSYLIEYCDKRKLLKDPFRSEVGEELTEEEVKRIARAFSEIGEKE